MGVMLSCSPALRAQLEAQLEACRSQQRGGGSGVTPRSRVEVVLSDKGDVGDALVQARVQRNTLRTAANAADAQATAAELGAVHIPRTKSTLQREASAADREDSGRYAQLGEGELSQELGSVQTEIEELRKQLGM
jgi:hypothetical protein